ncbi:LLM class flavin-dependent oxidoreductase [Mucilaginibacter sp. BJC16-A38]|uniref:LLM class flavin-dependent oxidoreductase n=1 Tax=Mucilaginibacter phenanthrenivorans TaxID=1234842 RepID=UPI002157E4E8|nr:LLM class flavin-dependent oxidoreductase [Mucilaginibacter phenanthrenivorans]MCR8556559.1 LLM class flavin-dependent oxidoreductase [Mucilaginibacter phenanthrenivorans]
MSIKALKDIAYSVLDLATVVEGYSIADTYHKSLENARQAEALGYSRYWFAEHHNMISVASSATSLLIGYIAGNTDKIRVGSGGIMLPNHSPLVVAEQFGTLETLYPGRIDLGLGRAPGSDQATAQAIRGQNMNAAFYFPKDVEALQRYFSADNFDGKVRAIPGEGLDIPIWILGSSTDSAKLAAAKGLPYAFASHFAPAYFKEAIAIYRDNFQPSAQLSKPYVMACVNVVAADTDGEAGYLATSVKQMFMGVITGRRQLLQPPVDDMQTVWSVFEEAAVMEMLAYSFIGSKETISKKLVDFVEENGLDEIMATTHVYDHKAKLKSFRLFAEVMKLA